MKPEEKLKKYNLIKEFEILNDYMGNTIHYSIKYTSENPNIRFADISKINIGITKLNAIKVSNFNKDFFNKENIETSVEKEEIIPIGLIDCYGADINANSSYITIIVDDKKDLYKVPQILKNIERAIEIKVQAIDFLDYFDGVNI